MLAHKIQCLGFIMDGNRRWAKNQGIPKYEGHKKGAEVFEKSIEWVTAEKIQHVVYYAFSTENWKRSEMEISYLIEIFRELLSKTNRSVKIRIIGRRSDFTEDIQQQMADLEKVTAVNYNTTTVWVALSYGGRAEILEAVNKAIADGRQLTEESFEKLLWTAELPEPDMIVRTGGAHGLSNFLTWKSVYSEIYFMEKLWPTLTKSDFDEILKEYEKRQRKRGA